MKPTTRISLLAPLLVSLALVACDNKDQPPAATTGQPSTASSAAITSAGAATYVIEPSTSKIEWTGSKVTTSHDGSFTSFTGSVVVAGNKPENAKIHVDIDPSSITTSEPKLVGHLKSPDFFDVAKFPKASFDSTSIVPGGAAGATHTITGNLTMHGITKAITFPATVTVDGSKVTATATFTLDRKDFGLVYPGMPDNLIKDAIAIRLSLQAPKKG